MKNLSNFGIICFQKHIIIVKGTVMYYIIDLKLRSWGVHLYYGHTLCIFCNNLCKVMVYMALSSKVSHFWHNGGIIWINTTRRSGTLGLDSFMNSGCTYRTEERKTNNHTKNTNKHNNHNNHNNHTINNKNNINFNFSIIISKRRKTF